MDGWMDSSKSNFSSALSCKQTLSACSRLIPFVPLAFWLPPPLRPCICSCSFYHNINIGWVCPCFPFLSLLFLFAQKLSTAPKRITPTEYKCRVQIIRDRIWMRVYMDAVRSNNQHKPPLSFRTTVQNQNLPTDVSKWHIFNLIWLLFRLFVSM